MQIPVWIWIILYWLAVVAGVVLLMKRAGGPDGSQETDLTKKSFDGSSQELERTVVVPTLDTPFADGVSAIWCCSFQMMTGSAHSRFIIKAR